MFELWEQNKTLLGFESFHTRLNIDVEELKSLE